MSMTRIKTYQVKELARLSGVSVRTLHHYDQIGLLVPTDRSAAGYRLYDEDNLLRLQQILIQRELGLPLEEIRKSLDDPEFDRKTALLQQKKLLQQKASATAEMILAIDKAISLVTRKETDGMNLKEIFDGFDPAKYEAEAKQRWGATDAYKESAKRTKNYTAEDWQRMKAEQDAIYQAAAGALAAGENPANDAAMDIAERHRLSIDRWFYPCSTAMHCGLADMYEGDVRFAENIDKYAAGLTPFFAAAIRANAKRSS